MNEFEIKRAIETLKITRDFLVSNNLNTCEHERHYEILIKMLTSRFVLLDIISTKLTLAITNLSHYHRL